MSQTITSGAIAQTPAHSSLSLRGFTTGLQPKTLMMFTCALYIVVFIVALAVDSPRVAIGSVEFQCTASDTDGVATGSIAAFLTLSVALVAIFTTTMDSDMSIPFGIAGTGTFSPEDGVATSSPTTERDAAGISNLIAGLDVQSTLTCARFYWIRQTSIFIMALIALAISYGLHTATELMLIVILGITFGCVAVAAHRKSILDDDRKQALAFQTSLADGNDDTTTPSNSRCNPSWSPADAAVSVILIGIIVALITGATLSTVLSNTTGLVLVTIASIPTLVITRWAYFVSIVKQRRMTPTDSIVALLFGLAPSIAMLI